MGSVKEEPTSLDSDETVAEGLLSDEAEVEDVSALAEEVEEKEEGEDFIAGETEEVKPPAPLEEHEISEECCHLAKTSLFSVESKCSGDSS